MSINQWITLLSVVAVALTVIIWIFEPVFGMLASVAKEIGKKLSAKEEAKKARDAPGTEKKMKSATSYSKIVINDKKERRNMSEKSFKRIITAAVCAILLIVLLFSSLSIVPEGYTGTKYRFGQLVETDMGTGLMLHAPFVEKISRVDLRAKVYETTMSAYTRDTQVVEDFPVKVTYMYDRSQIDNIVRNIGIKNVENTLLVPNVPSISKNYIAQYKGEELTQNRSRLESEIEETLREELNASGIIITDFNVIDIDFEDTFEENIRQKVAAEVAAATTKNKTAVIEEEAKQKLISAQSEADAAKVNAEAEAYAIKVVQEQLDQSPQYIEFVKAQRWNGVLPQAIGESINPFIGFGASEH